MHLGWLIVENDLRPLFGNNISMNNVLFVNPVSNSRIIEKYFVGTDGMIWKLPRSVFLHIDEHLARQALSSRRFAIAFQ